MTSAAVQPFCEKRIINIYCFDGSRINTRKTTERNIAFHTYNNHFCLLSKSNGFSFNKANEELKKTTLDLLIMSYVISMIKVLLNMIINLKKYSVI